MNKHFIYLNTFGNLPEKKETQAQVLDWRQYFNREAVPRRVPDQTDWNTRLLPALQDLRNKVVAGDFIHLRVKAALSVGFALGHTFPAVGQYQLEIIQSPPTPPQIWRTDTGEEHNSVAFTAHNIEGNASKEDAVVIIHAIPHQPVAGVVKSISTYLNDSAPLEFINKAKTQSHYHLPTIERLLLDGFSEDELRSLCLLQPEFAPVRHQLAEGISKKILVHRLLDFSQQRLLWPRLLSLLKAENPSRYALYADRLTNTHVYSHQFKGILILENETGPLQNRPLEGWEAVSLARASYQQVKAFINQNNPRRLHLFLITPLGLAVFLGHFWNAMGVEAQCYEYVGGGVHYAPSCCIALS